LVAYPERAAFGAPVQKTKLYDHGGATRRVRELFAAQVERVVWQYKLAPETIQLGARPGVPEIQIFTLHLKGDALHTDVLRTVDRAVRFPVIFELLTEGRTRVVAAFKRPSEAAKGEWVSSSYFETPWLPSGVPRANMPLALHLGGLYESLLEPLLPVPRRSGERLVDVVDRAERARLKRDEIDKMAARLTKEPQFNRKVELNAALRQLNAELEALTR
jgi:hypothetical protein